MPFEDLPNEFRDSDELQPWVLNEMLREMRRWRGLRGGGAVEVSGASGPNPPKLFADPAPPFHVRLTGAYAAGYPWEQVLVTPGRALVTTGVTGSAAGDPAFELRTGDTGLTADGSVYRAWRSPASNQILFEAGGGGTLEVKNTGGAINSGSSGTVTVYNADGTTLSAQTLTAWLFLSGTWGLNKRGYVSFIKGKYRVVSADC